MSKPIVAVVALFAYACGSAAPTAPLPTPGNPRYRVSGIVMEAAGAASIANAAVMLRHKDRTLNTRTDANGFYSFSFDTSGPYRPSSSVDTLGLLAAGDDPNWNSSGGHWTAVHLLSWGAAEIVHDMRLRTVRTLPAGQSMALSVEPDSSLEWNREFDPTFVSIGTLWEEFLVSVPTDGVLTLNARPDGDTVPILWCQYGGCPSFLVQGSVSIPVHAGTLYFNVQIPRGSAPQRIDIQTSLR